MLTGLQRKDLHGRDQPAELLANRDWDPSRMSKLYWIVLALDLRSRSYWKREPFAHCLNSIADSLSEVNHFFLFFLEDVVDQLSWTEQMCLFVRSAQHMG